MRSVVFSVASGKEPGTGSGRGNGAEPAGGTMSGGPVQPEGTPDAGGKGSVPWFRIGATIFLIAGLFYVFDAKAVLQRLASIDPGDAALAFVVLCIQYLSGALRWHYILLRHDVKMTLLKSLAIFGSASLANAVIPHSVAGLSVKGLLLKGQGAGTSRMLGVLLVERLAAAGGLAVCFMISLVLAFPHFHQMVTSPDSVTTAVLVGIVLALAGGGIMLRRMSVVQIFVREIRSSFLRADVIAFLVLLSAMIVYLGFFSIALLAWGMDIDIAATDLMTVLPLVAFAAALPVSLGGWGVREGMMVATLSLFGVPADAAFALSITYGLSGTVVAALLGAVSAMVGVPGREGR